MLMPVIRMACPVADCGSPLTPTAGSTASRVARSPWNGAASWSSDLPSSNSFRLGILARANGFVSGLFFPSPIPSRKINSTRITADYNQRMPILDLKKFNSYRARTFRLPPAARVASPKAALQYVNERGFIYFWPIKGIDLPSLWVAVAGNRVVADKHDDPGHITWGWKDNALNKKIWYYAKVLRGKATMISLEVAPYFYALSENYGSPEEDYLLAYEEGRLTQAAKQVYEAVLKEGALNTLDLRRAAKLANAREAEFNKALEVL